MACEPSSAGVTPLACEPDAAYVPPLSLSLSLSSIFNRIPFSLDDDSEDENPPPPCKVIPFTPQLPIWVCCTQGATGSLAGDPVD